MKSDPGLIQVGFRYALSLCHDRNEAKDLVQDAWLRVARYEVVTSGLFVRAIRHAYIDTCRRPRLMQLNGAGALDKAIAPQVGDGDQQDELANALGTLKTDEREAIFLSVVEGYTAQEIADLSGRSRNTVLSLIRRGKSKLRERLGQEQNNGAAACEEGLA